MEALWPLSHCNREETGTRKDSATSSFQPQIYQSGREGGDLPTLSDTELMALVTLNLALIPCSSVCVFLCLQPFSQDELVYQGQIQDFSWRN